MTKGWSKKWSGPLMATVLVSTMLISACGGATEGQSSTGNGGSAGATTLKVELFDRGNTPAGYTITDSYLTNLIQERFGDPNNIKVQFVPVPRSEET